MTDTVTEAELSALRVNHRVAYTSVTITSQEGLRCYFLFIFYFFWSLPVQETTQETLKRFWKAIQAFVLGSTPLCGGSRKEVKNAKITAQTTKTSESGPPAPVPSQAARLYCRAGISQQVITRRCFSSLQESFTCRCSSSVESEPSSAAKHHVSSSI